MKKFLCLILALVLVLSLTACGKNNANNDNSSAAVQGETQNVAAKSDGYEKFSQIKIGMTEDEVNAILGEPTKVDKAYYYYNIAVNGKDMEIEVWINTSSGLVIYTNGGFTDEEYRAEFADAKTDLSTASGLESEEITTYDQCVSAFKTNGYLASASEDGEKTYFWVDKNDGYMNVTFDADLNIKSFAGYC